jgi:hypothetical protein
VSRKRCPNCGKRVPESEPCCPRCGHSIPIYLGESEQEKDVPWGEADDEIDNPDLLAEVEAYVKGLPDLPYPRRGAPVPANEARSGSAGKAEQAGPDVGECPICGRQARKGWDECPWCGTPLSPEVWALKPPEAGAGPPVDANDDVIFDPELLEQAEEYVKLLPDGLFRRGERPRMPVAGRSAERTDSAAPLDCGESNDEIDEEEPEPVGGECPACGRQAQKGWTQCPWCGTALGLGASR